MKSIIIRLLIVAILAGLVPGMALAQEPTDLYMKRFSLFGWIGGGGGSQTVSVEYLFSERSDSKSFPAAGVAGGGGFAFNDLFTPNLRIGLELEGQYLSGTRDDVTIETSTIIPKLMISYILVTSVGGFEPGVFYGPGIGSVCESGGGSHGDCDRGFAGEFGGGLYWTPSKLRWLSIGADFKYTGVDSIFGYQVDVYTGMVNARFQYNFGE